MRTLLCGGFAGVAAAVPVAGVLAINDKVELADKVVAVLIVAAVVTILWWVFGALRALQRWFRGVVGRRRARKQRRRDLAVVRKAAGTPVFGAGEDEITMPLEDAPRPRTSMSRTQFTNVLREAEAATQRGDFQGAVERYSDALDADPDHVEAHLARGRVHLDLGDYNRAMSDFVAAEDLQPDSPDPPIAMGELYFARKDYARAIGCFDVALGLAPEHAMAHCRRGLSYFYRKNYTLALEDLFRARALDPEIPYLDAHIAATQRKTKEKAPSKKR